MLKLKHKLSYDSSCGALFCCWAMLFQRLAPSYLSGLQTGDFLRGLRNRTQNNCTFLHCFNPSFFNQQNKLNRERTDLTYTLKWLSKVSKSNVVRNSSKSWCMEPWAKAMQSFTCFLVIFNHYQLNFCFDCDRLQQKYSSYSQN